MSRFGLLTGIAVGAGGTILFAGWRKRRALLGSPIETDGESSTTPQGHFGATRKGPPAHRHQGIDLAAAVGSRVLAVGDGLIVATDPGLGKIVRKLLLDVPGAWTLEGSPIESVVYADLGEPLVEPGDHVRRSDTIALVDRAGFVHVAVKAHGVFIDPKLAGFAYQSAKGSASWLV